MTPMMTPAMSPAERGVVPLVVAIVLLRAVSELSNETGTEAFRSAVPTFPARS